MDHKTYPFILEKADPLTIEAGGAEFIGHAAVFSNVDDGGDIIQPGAFAKTISERGSKVALVYQHDWKAPIGRVTELREDDRGLYVRAKISDTSLGRDVSTLLRDGAITGLSIGYNPVKEQTIQLADGRRARSLQEVKLFEVSPVTFPMNELATVAAVKAAIPYKKTPLADEGMAWDGPGQMAAAGDDMDALRTMCAIVLNEGENKGDYKLPHHMGKVPHACVMKGVMAAGAALMGARGGVMAPEADMMACKGHLGKHYEEFGRDAPWSKSFAPEHLIDYEIEEKVAIALAMLEADKADDVKIGDGRHTQECGPLAAHSNHTHTISIANGETKEGRVLSARNRGVVQAALDALKELLAASEPPTKEPSADEEPDKGDKSTDTPEALKAQVEELRARVMARSKLLSLGR